MTVETKTPCCAAASAEKQTDDPRKISMGFFARIGNSKFGRLVAENWYPVVLALFLFPLICVVIGNIGFLFHVSLSKWHAGVALLLSFFLMYMLAGKQIARTLYSIGVFLSVLFLLLLAYSLPMSIDIWDSIGYHKPAALLMADGWNPIWDSEDYTVIDGMPATDPKEVFFQQNIRTGQKAQWIFAAMTYLVTGNIDAGAYANSLFAGIAFLVTAWSLKYLFRLATLERLAAALVIAGSTVVISESIDGMIDGILASLMTILLFSLAGYVKTKDIRFLPFIAGATPYIANVKLTGIAYVLIVLALFSATIVILAWRNRSRIDRPYAATILLAGFFTILLGINPYITNIIHHGHPLYPTLGNGKFRDPIKEEFFEPPESIFHNTSTLQCFVLSHLIAQPNSFSTPLRKTLDLYPKEVLSGGYNCPVGVGVMVLCGFGPLFSIAFAASIVLIFFVNHRLTWLVVLSIAATICIMPHSYIARYIPQLWIVPPLIFCAIRSQSRESGLIAVRTSVLFWLLAGVLFLGSVKAANWQYTMTVGSTNASISCLKWMHDNPGHAVIEFDDPCLSYFQKRLLLDSGVKSQTYRNKTDKKCADLTPCANIRFATIYLDPRANAANSTPAPVPFGFKKSISEIYKLRLRQFIAAWTPNRRTASANVATHSLPSNGR